MRASPLIALTLSFQGIASIACMCGPLEYRETTFDVMEDVSPFELAYAQGLNEGVVLKSIASGQLELTEEECHTLCTFSAGLADAGERTERRFNVDECHFELHDDITISDTGDVGDTGDTGDTGGMGLAAEITVGTVICSGIEISNL